MWVISPTLGRQRLWNRDPEHRQKETERVAVIEWQTFRLFKTAGHAPAKV